MTVVTALAQPPNAGLPEACGSRADLKAAYRVFANEAIEPAELLAKSEHRRLAQKRPP